MAKTQVALDGITFSGSVEIYLPEIGEPSGDQQPLLSGLVIGFAGAHADYGFGETYLISTEPSVYGWRLSRGSYIDVHDVDSEVVDFGEGTDSFRDLGAFSLDCSGYGLNCSRADNPIGDKANATHAKERVATDEHNVPANVTVTATCGNTMKSTTSEAGGLASIVWTISFMSEQTPDVPTGIDLLRITDLKFGEMDIDTSGLADTHAGGNLWVGDYGGNGIRFWMSGLVTSSQSWGAYGGLPTMHTFSGVHVTNMDGEDLPDLVLAFTGAEVYDAEAEAWAPLRAPQAELQAMTIIPNWGLYSWDQSPPPDGAVRCVPGASFHIDAASARAHGLDGFAETA